MIVDHWKDLYEDEAVEAIIAKAKRLGVPSRAEERYLVLKAQGGDAEARENMIVRNTPFVVVIVKRYRGLGVEQIDLFNAGMAGLNTAIDKYDMKKYKVRFISYAVWWIRQAMLQETQNHGRTMRVPVNRHAALAKVKKAVRAARGTGRPVDPAAVAKACGIKEDAARDLIAIVEEPMSMSWAVAAGSRVGHAELELGDTIPAEDERSVDDEIEAEWVMRVIDQHAKLTDRERTIIRFRYIEGRTLDSIGADFGLSRERIRQVEAKAMVKIKKIFADMDRKHGISRGDRISMLSLGG